MQEQYEEQDHNLEHPLADPKTVRLWPSDFLAQTVLQWFCKSYIKPTCMLVITNYYYY